MCEILDGVFNVLVRVGLNGMKGRAKVLFEQGGLDQQMSFDRLFDELVH